MARSRRRSDFYNQPGLFDFQSAPQQPCEGPWKPGDVVASGGVVEPQPEPTSLFDMEPTVVNDTNLRFMSFGSGSSGNCSYIGTDKFGILIDAGVDGATIEKALKRNGIDIYNVVAIIITHDHTDHIAHAYNLLKRHRHISLYCTPKTLKGMLGRRGVASRIRDYHKAVYKEFQFYIKDFAITPFEVSHDGADNSGFCIEYNRHRFVVVTDTGFITERAEYYMRRATALMIESDYDYDMLRTGHYPEHLKARIMASKGHLDNRQVAEFLTTAWTPQLTNIFLCHLSKDNNTPELALQSARQALTQAGAASVGDASESIKARRAPVQLYALPRFDPSPLFVIR